MCYHSIHIYFRSGYVTHINIKHNNQQNKSPVAVLEASCKESAAPQPRRESGGTADRIKGRERLVLLWHYTATQ